MTNKQIYQAMGWMGITAVLATFLFVAVFEGDDFACKAEKRKLKTAMTGVVTAKFRDDKNHMYETIKLSHKPDRHTFISEKSGFFLFVQKGDSIFKPKGTLEVQLFRDTMKKVFVLSYECEEE
ncbi:MAG: hypothetical protein AB8F95_06720 [Bacteroidia bacterium]